MTINWSKTIRLPEVDDLQHAFPEAHIEYIGDRNEIVIYTGWTVAADEHTLVPMDEHKD